VAACVRIADELPGWLRAGRIAFPPVLVKGIDQAPAAIQAIAEGRYFGTVVVEL
jgi:NADPH-dependent curcumin reductase CurA